MRADCCAARAEGLAVPARALLRALIAERDGNLELALRLLRQAMIDSPELLQEELPHLLKLVEPRSRTMCSANW